MEISRNGLGLQLSQLLPISAAGRIDAVDFLILGEVVFCMPKAEQFLAGIHIEQVLGPLPELAELHHKLGDANRIPARSLRKLTRTASQCS